MGRSSRKRLYIKLEGQDTVLAKFDMVNYLGDSIVLANRYMDTTSVDYQSLNRQLAYNKETLSEKKKLLSTRIYEDDIERLKRQIVIYTDRVKSIEQDLLCYIDENSLNAQFSKKIVFKKVAGKKNKDKKTKVAIGE